MIEFTLSRTVLAVCGLALLLVAVGTVSDSGERIESDMDSQAAVRLSSFFQFFISFSLLFFGFHPPCRRSDQSLRLGSRMSRSLSPRMLKQITVSMTAMPGTKMRLGASQRNFLPAAIMPPHSGWGGVTPMPR